jgi:hypothetical protein
MLASSDRSISAPVCEGQKEAAVEGTWRADVAPISVNLADGLLVQQDARGNVLNLTLALGFTRVAGDLRQPACTAPADHDNACRSVCGPTPAERLVMGSAL